MSRITSATSAGGHSRNISRNAAKLRASIRLLISGTRILPTIARSRSSAFVTLRLNERNDERSSRLRSTKPQAPNPNNHSTKVQNGTVRVHIWFIGKFEFPWSLELGTWG